MEFKFTVGEFKKTIAQLSTIVKPHSAIPILGYISLRSDSLGVTAHGTDHRVYYSTLVDSEPPTGHTEPSEVLLEAAETKSMLAKLSPTAEITFRATPKELIIKSGNSTWRRMRKTSVDMPAFPELHEDQFQELSGPHLFQVLSSALKASPKRQTFNPGITQLLFREGMIVSGDGLWYQRVQCPELSHVETTMPVEGTKSLLGILAGWGDVPVQFGHNSTHVVVRTSSHTVGITRLSLEFPEILEYLDHPKITHTEKFSALSKELNTALQQVLLSAPEETHLVTITLDNPTKAKLTAKTFEGSAEVFVSCTWDGADRVLLVDGQALRGMITASHNPEKFTIRLGPDARKNPSTLYTSHSGVEAALVQLRSAR